MMLMRAAQIKDVDSIYELAIKSGIGLTTLPKDKDLLKKRIQWSLDSFKNTSQKPGDHYYFFVLEDTSSQKIAGTSAIEAKTGVHTPFYSYKVSRRTRMCHSLGIRNDYDVLSLVNDNQGCSELCTLFLNPDYRKNHNGLLLSKARFLFIADHRERFCDRLIAELRGVSDGQGRSPFWEHVGAHFFHMPFSQADELTTSTNKQFIADLIPRNPVYVKLIAQEAQDVIGKAHPSSIPAMQMLLSEGFRYNNYVDIFDAGPTIECPVDEIKTIKRSALVKVGSLSDEVSGTEYLISNQSTDFRAIHDLVVYCPEKNRCIISKKAAETLGIKEGSMIRISPIKAG